MECKTCGIILDGSIPEYKKHVWGSDHYCHDCYYDMVGDEPWQDPDDKDGECPMCLAEIETDPEGL
jgi:hypothetical protein